MERDEKCIHGIHDFALYWNGKKWAWKCYYCGKEVTHDEMEKIIFEQFEKEKEV